MSCPICDGPMMASGNPFKSDKPEVVYCPPCTIRKLAAFDGLVEACKKARQLVCPDGERDGMEDWAKDVYDVTTAALAEAEKELNNGN